MYYKVYKAGKVCDALENLQCVRYFSESGILRCKRTDRPQGVISTDGEHIWHVDGWDEFPQASGWDDDTVILEESDDMDLYDEIMAALRSGEDYTEFEVEPQTEEIDAPPTPAERLAALEKAAAEMTTLLSEQADALVELASIITEEIDG